MITWIRSLITFIGFLFIYLIITPVMLISTVLLTGSWYRNVTIAWSKILVGWMRIGAGIDYRIIGAENLQYLKERPHFIISNHQSALETLIYTIILPPHSFVLKKELLYIPFFGWGLAKAKPIAINRKDGKNALKQISTQAKERFAEGRSVIIFPEGTRVPFGQVVPFKKGGFIVAKQLAAPVLPMAINSGIAAPKGRFLKEPGIITIVIGKPIESESLSTAELAKETERWIRGHIVPTLNVKKEATEAELRALTATEVEVK
ncbi:lysophospholipid acyltransferase family protein [Ignatzschineria cameli]|uniref:1-acyl-sn-glycerol-3-phosphate acyltransferase n=1 Tax=Ignatzschineria cameli TaxID=2182793 RepID=A0A2U2AQL9_9GAMM|nr:lysophospholipid acyltransferase family protein [Ignatzschineria cameli]PWD85334.1 1-acyl-sn-glycerol-3-phosphate acyltransferase [Ignatzschineria cameli]PWD86190.1 1-acyl-sn-glycerol-3-phosphate acyltransferase [Ignatzschineria cameli]PWD88637.1 1-acyl-sn-glycerol-3-phosphate acyltransferase [Ignatzschineria cameli]PWD89560.1 1-acyl-sn-glycerol-3-phosphate acyltransferase [Ignatzschineria cameli]PWD90185.1 1-acyl-sn-glycerol-3-phosphate acyltransferase [Ignatzschineria cameli]